MRMVLLIALMLWVTLSKHLTFVSLSPLLLRTSSSDWVAVGDGPFQSPQHSLCELQAYQHRVVSVAERCCLSSDVSSALIPRTCQSLETALLFIV